MKQAVRIYEMTKAYPGDERFGLVAETRNTARSVPYNISEDKMRVPVKEDHHFVSIAHGSLGELHTRVLLGNQLKYLKDSELAELEREIEEIGRMLRGLMRS